MSQYFVSHDGQQLGPFTLDQIMEKVQASELTLMDYIYDNGKQDWLLLMEHSELAEKLKDFKPAAPPKPEAAPSADEKEVQETVAKVQQKSEEPLGEHMVKEWYVLKGENKFGPFTYPDVLKMLQQKVVYEFDFAWHPGLESWMRIAELEAFRPENVKSVQNTLMPELEEVFYRRRHRRVDYGATVLVHDNKQVWKGRSVEISAGGAGVIMENAMLVPGQTLYLHFKPAEGVPPFNAVCEVVSKKYVDGVKEKAAPIRYGLKFTNISTQAQKVLQDYSVSASAA